MKYNFKSEQGATLLRFTMLLLRSATPVHSANRRAQGVEQATLFSVPSCRHPITGYEIPTDGSEYGDQRAEHRTQRAEC